MKRELNQHGFPCYRDLPDGARAGRMEDFHQHGQKKVGMEYLVCSEIQDVYFINTIKPATRGEKIKAFIDAGILYVLTNN